jgi:rhamnose transport system substrate-binding protein
MKQALKNPKYEKMKLVEIVYGNDQPEKSRTEAEGLISKHPNLRGILAPTTVGVEQAAKTVDTAGVYPGGPAAKNGGIVVTGLGNPNQMRDYLKRGIIPSCSLWNVPDIGYIAACLASGLVKGTIHAEPGKSFDVPGKGSFTFGPNNTVIAGPMVVFTKDNVDQFHF